MNPIDKSLNMSACGRNRGDSHPNAMPRSVFRARRFAVMGMALLLATVMGCRSTRSISNSAPPDAYGYAPRGTSTDPGFEYRGELNEFDVLGVDRSQAASEEEIGRALAQAARVELKPGSRVLLVQSGAVFPDGPMVSEMENITLGQLGVIKK